jgi:hypothetical protein
MIDRPRNRTYVAAMSEQPLSLDLLGRLVPEMQAEQRQTHAGLDAIETRFAVIEARLSGLETRFGTLEHAVHLGFDEIAASNRRLESMLAEFSIGTNLIERAGFPRYH